MIINKCPFIYKIFINKYLFIFKIIFKINNLFKNNIISNNYSRIFIFKIRIIKPDIINYF